ncbi:hypothetical protein OH76DRAFT_559727 [Lentinus brumalis]|uniref:Uncharacterized protein n=1 Tax=Lentinus brumalis TaxID=2498619 RepID=A0A371D9G2_9APHY|nr:hypothetical protein OH76DRAFT_559727 [Polyporus brumalis]
MSLREQSCRGGQEQMVHAVRWAQSVISLSLPIAIRPAHHRHHARTTARPSRVSQVRGLSLHHIDSLLVLPFPSFAFSLGLVYDCPTGRHGSQTSPRAICKSSISVQASTDTPPGSRCCRRARVLRPSSAPPSDSRPDAKQSVSHRIPLERICQAARDDEHQNRALECCCSPLARGLKSLSSLLQLPIFIACVVSLAVKQHWPQLFLVTGPSSATPVQCKTPPVPANDLLASEQSSLPRGRHPEPPWIPPVHCSGQLAHHLMAG